MTARESTAVGGSVNRNNSRRKSGGGKSSRRNIRVEQKQRKMTRGESAEAEMEERTAGGIK